MTHTPGPWTLDYVISGAFAIQATVDSDQIQIATRAPISSRHAEFVANAHLIALKAQAHGGCFCQMAIGNPMMRTHSAACEQAFDAIAKAEGRDVETRR